jgi:hypothetical protein
MQVNPRKIKEVEDRSDIVIDYPKPAQILKHLRTRDRVSYIGTDDKYRSGGFVIAIAEDGSSISLSGGNLKWTIKTPKIATIFIVSNDKDE